MLFEGLAKRILQQLNPSDTNPIPKEVLNANHDRYGKMLDDNYTKQQELDSKLRKKKVIPFKQFKK